MCPSLCASRRDKVVGFSRTLCHDFCMKRRQRKTKRPPPGSTPGEIVVNPAAPPTRMRLFAFAPDEFEEREIESPAEIKACLEAGRWPVVWLDVDGLGSIDALRTIGEAVGLHKLTLADVANTYQRPKTEDFGDYLLVVTRAPYRGQANENPLPPSPAETLPADTGPLGMSLETEQVSILLAKGLVVTFQEAAKPGDCFGPLRDRIRKGTGGIRARGADYLMYSLLDSVVDAYFPLLEEMGEELDRAEDRTLENTNIATMRMLHRMRRELLTVRRAAWPLREAVGSLQRNTTPLISDQTRVYLRDCYDHAVQIIDVVETSRELSAGLMELHMTAASYRMNEVMKVLTIITTIFIPLSFIAGIYGMNFDTSKPGNMPELSWHYAYPVVLLGMGTVMILMLIIFWRRGWIGHGRLGN